MHVTMSIQVEISCCQSELVYEEALKIQLTKPHLAW